MKEHNRHSGMMQLTPLSSIDFACQQTACGVQAAKP